MSISKDAVMSAISKVKDDAVQNVVGSMFIDSEQYKKQKELQKMLAITADKVITDVPDELTKLPVPAIIDIGSDETKSTKLKWLCETYSKMSEENKSVADMLMGELESNPDSAELISDILKYLKKQKPSTNGR